MVINHIKAFKKVSINAYLPEYSKVKMKINKIFEQTIKAIMMILLLFSLKNAYSQEIRTDNQLDTEITNFMDTYHIPGLSALIIVEDEIVWQKQYGWSTIGVDSVSDSTIFVLASSCKTVIVTALMQLWENGEFELNDHINNYIPFDVINPNFPNDSITFEMLLTHTSSIKDNWSYMNFYNGDAPVQLGVYLENYFTPGGGYYDAQQNFSSNYAPSDHHWEYSNIGASLAAYLVETISGTSFNQYCIDNIFAPLGMDHTSWFLENSNTQNLATPYGYNTANNQYYPYFHWGVAFYPAGQLRSTPSDLSKFIFTYLNSGSYQGINILDSATIEMITTTYVLNWQGLIWRYQNDCWWHSGRSVGCSSMLSYNKSNKIGIIYTTNMEIPGGSYDWRWDMHQLLNDYAENNILTNIETQEIANHSNKLKQLSCSPNPFTKKIAINYSLESDGFVKVDIIDNRGNNITSLVNDFQLSGKKKILWDGTDESGNNLNDGVFHLLISVDNEMIAKTILKINQ